MMKIKRYSLLYLFCLLQLFVTAQTAGYHYQAAIDNIKDDGFYNIVLTPAILAHLKTDCSDLRIVNDSGKWVPHLLRVPSKEYISDAVLWDLKIIKKENTIAATDLIVERIDSNTSNLLLKIKNTVAERYCILTGSDDLASWFIINDSIVIKPVKDHNGINSNFTLEFPPVNYKYFRVRITNKGKEPFNIISVASRCVVPLALINKELIYHSPVENPPCRITQKDSGNHSYIKVVQSEVYHFDKISLKISGPKYYSRNANLYIPGSSVHSFSNPGQLAQSFIVSNNSTLEFVLPITNAKSFYILIQNQDNPPLKIEEVKTYINYTVATAWLEKTNHYRLIMDNAAAGTPNYDLQLQQINLRQAVPAAGISAIIALQQTGTAGSNKWMIWLVIGFATLVLGFFTSKLVSDMTKTKP